MQLCCRKKRRTRCGETRFTETHTARLPLTPETTIESCRRKPPPPATASRSRAAPRPASLGGGRGGNEPCRARAVFRRTAAVSLYGTQCREIGETSNYKDTVERCRSMEVRYYLSVYGTKTVNELFARPRVGKRDGRAAISRNIFWKKFNGLTRRSLFPGVRPGTMFPGSRLPRLSIFRDFPPTTAIDNNNVTE